MSVAGSVSAWRAIRREVTPLQLSETGVVGFEVTMHILPCSADIRAQQGRYSAAVRTSHCTV
jgi:hypothetical protein